MDDNSDSDEEAEQEAQAFIPKPPENEVNQAFREVKDTMNLSPRDLQSSRGGRATKGKKGGKSNAQTTVTRSQFKNTKKILFND